MNYRKLDSTFGDGLEEGFDDGYKVGQADTFELGCGGAEHYPDQQNDFYDDAFEHQVDRREDTKECVL